MDLNLKPNKLFDGRYRLLTHIGDGASAQVWKAADTQANNLIVALKIFSASEGVGTEGWQDFIREFTSVYNLIHSNLLAPTGYNRSRDNGVPYLILQYCDNGSASSMTGRMDEDTLLHFLHDVSAGLAYLHDHGIIHQDIKPDNILLDEQCNFLVTDFGISSIASQNVSSSGSTAYMAPERFADREHPEEAPISVKASDVWSLGATAYELVTGELPYGPLGGINQRANAELKPLPDSLQPQVRDIIMACLSANPWERPRAYDIQSKIENYWSNGGHWNGSPRRKIYLAAASAAILLVAFFTVDFTRTKVRYYKDYVEAWGVPQGIGRVSASQKKQMARLYRFEYKLGKLRRVSHINGNGCLIDDGESERVERPVEMTFTYSGNKLSVARAFSRGGMVEYMKCYNEKQNNITFRYDDKYETEKRLNAKTIGYINPFKELDQQKGQISHYLLSYDKKGFVDTLRYANMSNKPCCDQDGIFARTFIRDSKGRVVEECYLGFDDHPKSTPWGLGKKVFSYDDDDNLVKVVYLTVDGKPATDAKGGVYIYEMEYDKNGNIIAGLHKNPDGNLMIPEIMGYAAIYNSYDKKGHLVYSELRGMDDKPMTCVNGFCGRRYGYDVNGYVNYVCYLDVNGDRTLYRDGYNMQVMSNDQRGNTLEMWFLLADSSLVMSSQGYAGYRNLFDSLGNVVEYVTLGIDRQPVATTLGVYGLRIEYDMRGMATKRVYLGADLNPTMSDEHIAVVRYEYDDHANEIRRSFYDVTGEQLVMNTSNVAGWNNKYDEYGNETEFEYFDDKGNPCISGSGYSKMTLTYNEYGKVLQQRYFGVDGKYVMVNGCAGSNYKYDNRGNRIESMDIGLDGKLAANHYIQRFTYDKNDNITSLSYFKSNNVATMYNGYHRYQCQYDSRNNPVETRYYNTNSRLTSYGNDTYAIQRDCYDDRGFRVETSFYDANEKPVCCKEGWSKSRREYDAMGNVLRQLFFNQDGSPTDPNKMVPEGVCKYDYQGHLTYLASADGNGRIIDNPKTGWAIMEKKYDNHGNTVEEAYYDARHNPVVIKGQEYCKIIYIYDNDGWYAGVPAREGYLLFEVQRYDLRGCYEKEIYHYNEKGMPTEWRRCYGDGSLKPYANGACRYTISYQPDGIIPTTQRVYNIAGQCIFHRRYNAKNSKWGEFEY